jgi:hypothetical protein
LSGGSRIYIAVIVLLSNKILVLLILTLCLCFGLFAGAVRVAYSVVQGTSSPLSADLTLASPGQDFVAVPSAYVDVAAGVTFTSIPVTIINDLLPEIDEVFLVRLNSVTLLQAPDGSNPPPRLASSGTVAQVTISANDGAQGVVVFASGSRKWVQFQNLMSFIRTVIVIIIFNPKLVSM